MSERKMSQVDLRAETEEEKIVLGQFYLELITKGEATLRIDKRSPWDQKTH